MENTHLRAIRSFYSAAHGGLLTLDDDVLSIVSQVRQEFGDKVQIQLDPETGWYHFVGIEDDGNTERLIFSVEQLDPRALERLRRADSHARGFEDSYDAAEREQDEAQARIDRAYADKIAEAGEELLFHVQKAGQAPFLAKQVYIPRGVNADR